MNKLAKTIYTGNVEKKFWQHREGVPLLMVESGLFTESQIEAVKKAFVGQQLALIHSELSEALEADRGRGNTFDKTAFENYFKYTSDKTEEEKFKTAFEKYVKDSFQDEICDTVIRLLDLCGGLDIDIHWHIKQKLKFNKLRSAMHGGKKY